MENDPLHILLADDNEIDRRIFKKAFELLEIKTIVHTVNDGVELMDYLTQKELPLPHLLFLDLNMPLKGGIACLKEIKCDKKLKEIFVAMYSSSTSEQDIEETFCNGANIYIKKPDDFSTLKQALNKAVLVAHHYQEQPFNRANFLLKI